MRMSDPPAPPPPPPPPESFVLRSKPTKFAAHCEASARAGDMHGFRRRRSFLDRDSPSPSAAHGEKVTEPLPADTPETPDTAETTDSADPGKQKRWHDMDVQQGCRHAHSGRSVSAKWTQQYITCVLTRKDRRVVLSANYETPREGSCCVLSKTLHDVFNSNHFGYLIQLYVQSIWSAVVDHNDGHNYKQHKPVVDCAGLARRLLVLVPPSHAWGTTAGGSKDRRPPAAANTAPKPFVVSDARV